MKGCDRKTNGTFFWWFLFVFIALAITVVGSVGASASTAVRIVMLPLVVFEGDGLPEQALAVQHYHRMMGQLATRLDSQNFEIMNPFATKDGMSAFHAFRENARKNPAYAATQICREYDADAVYISWCKIKKYEAPDGYFKVSSLFDGGAYDRAGRDIGAAVSGQYRVTKRDYEEAVLEIEKFMGDRITRSLKHWVSEYFFNPPLSYFPRNSDEWEGIGNNKGFE